MADNTTNLIATGLATTAKNVTGGSAAVTTMRGAAGTPLDTIPGAPYTVVGPPQGNLTPGSWEIVLYRFPMRCYVARLSDSARMQHDTNEYLDGFLTAFRTGIELGVAGVVSATIETFDTDKFQEVGTEEYQLIDFVVRVEVARGETYTP